MTTTYKFDTRLSSFSNLSTYDGMIHRKILPSYLSNHDIERGVRISRGKLTITMPRGVTTRSQRRLPSDVIGDIGELSQFQVHALFFGHVQTNRQREHEVIWRVSPNSDQNLTNLAREFLLNSKMIFGPVDGQSSEDDRRAQTTEGSHSSTPPVE